MNHKEYLEKYGKWAIVTGASSGIGREFSKQLGEKGFSLVLISRRRKELEDLQSELSSLHGTKSIVLALDLAKSGWLQEVRSVTQSLEVGLLVASAGFGTSGLFWESDWEKERQMLEVNCASVLDLVREFSPQFIKQGRGGIILLSSIVAFQGVARSAHYSATKAYIQNLAEGLAEEFRDRGVDVLSVAPGPVATEFATVSDLRMGQAENPRVVASQSLKALGKRTTVRPGFLAKFLETMLSTAPRWGRVKIMKQVMKGMTNHQ